MMGSDQLQKNLKTYRLSLFEYQRIQSLLGRDPEGLEWAVFSALWSEHCSYKSSKVFLRKLAETRTSIEGVTDIVADGENAGVIDLGQDEKVVFKIESHNHPSFIEPYQGAATGVGGILRDIFTMGARPVALANYLCFGEIQDDPYQRHLFNGVVGGISGYGNAVGVPMLTGKTFTDKAYQKNIIVNAMAVGLLRKGEKIALSAAKTVGNWVVYVGARTGRDGIHGAAMASESFGDDSASKRPNVQIGDPFYEKLLIESCMEVIHQDLVESIQDMGAAGLTSSSFEMSAKGNLGMNLYLDQVPLRDSTMSPEDILLSEAQERMLLICFPEKFDQLKATFDRWGLECCRIGEVISESKIHLHWKGKILNSIDPQVVVENAPVYERPIQYAADHVKFEESDLTQFGYHDDWKSWVQLKIEDPMLGDKKHIYRQFDNRVGGKTVLGCESEIGCLRLPDSGRGLAVALGGRPGVLKINPFFGALDSVFEPSLKMAIRGFRVAGVSDGLNFGNPEDPQIMGQFAAVIEGLKQSCLSLKIPIVSGNVSFYNETKGQQVIATPAIGLVGIRDHVQDIPKDFLDKENLKVFLFELPIYQLLEVDETIKDSGWDSSLVNKLALQVDFIRGWSMKVKPYACQIVGLDGFAVQIRKMFLKDSAELEIHQLTSEQRMVFTQELSRKSRKFYQIIMAFESELSQAQIDELSKSEIVVRSLGVTRSVRH